MLSHVRDLLGHSAWADAVFFRAWSKSDREDREVRERAAHAAGTQELFLQVFRGDAPLPWDRILKGEVKPPWADKPLAGFEEIRTKTSANHDQLDAYAASLDDAALERMVTIPWFPDPPCVLSVANALVQVAMHTQHHRGQNMTRIRQIGGKTVNTDFIIWLWKSRPAGVWEDA